MRLGRMHAWGLLCVAALYLGSSSVPGVRAQGAPAQPAAPPGDAAGVELTAAEKEQAVAFIRDLERRNNAILEELKSAMANGDRELAFQLMRKYLGGGVPPSGEQYLYHNESAKALESQLADAQGRLQQMNALLWPGQSPTARQMEEMERLKGRMGKLEKARDEHMVAAERHLVKQVDVWLDKLWGILAGPAEATRQEESPAAATPSERASS